MTSKWLDAGTIVLYAHRHSGSADMARG